MPIYEYQCKKCGHRFEKIQKFSDKLIRKCPDCGGPVEQLLSAPAVQFKGSGWYVTDYARKSAGPSDSGSKESKRDEKTKTDIGAKSETKETSAKETAKDSSARKSDKHK